MLAKARFQVLSHASRSLIALIGFGIFLSQPTSLVLGDQGCVRFDIPATLPACDISDQDTLLQNQRLVEVTIPVTSIVACKNDRRVQEMLIQVRGMGTGLQVADYAPRTRLYSDIEGSISIEKKTERSSRLGLNASSGVDIVDLSAAANIGSSDGNTTRYQQIPAQKLLLASGTISRGKGAYFKFRHSPQTTLEGGHEIILTLKVPSTWRGGLIRIDCLATGKEKMLFGESDFQAGTSSFSVATWLKGDRDAQQTVNRYVQIESQIRSYANAQAKISRQRKADDPIGNWLGHHDSQLPEDWATRFSLYDSRSIQGKIKPHLPKRLQRATDEFLACRRNVMRLAH